MSEQNFIPTAAEVMAQPEPTQDQIAKWKHGVRRNIGLFMVANTPFLQKHKPVVFDYLSDIPDNNIVTSGFKVILLPDDDALFKEHKVVLWLTYWKDFVSELRDKGYQVEVCGDQNAPCLRIWIKAS